MTISVRQWNDRVSWNSFTSSVPHAHFQQAWEWGELAPDLGGKAVRVAAVDGGEIVGAAQIFVNPMAGGIATHLSVPRGPAMRYPSVEIMGPLLDQARLIGSEARAAGIKLEPNVSRRSEAWISSLASLGLHPSFPPSQPRSSWLLDVSPDEDALLAGMKSKTRYNVRLAARKGVTIHEGSADDMAAFYHLYTETALRDDFFIHPRTVYDRMFALFRRAGNFCMLVARFQGEMIAAVTLIRFGATCWYLHGASSNQQRNTMATYLLQWEAIKQAKRWECSLYDFRAVPDVLDPDQDMYGVYRFKEGFGGCHFTTLDTWSAPYRPITYGLWQLYFRTRFDFQARKRRAAGLPARQFA